MGFGARTDRRSLETMGPNAIGSHQLAPQGTDRTGAGDRQPARRLDGDC